MKEFFVDFHAHPTLRAFNTPPVSPCRNLWDKTFNHSLSSSIARMARMQTQEIAKESQSYFYAYAQNNFRVIFDSLYPVEKSWFRFRKMPAYLVKARSRDDIMLSVFGIEKSRLDYLRMQQSYFEELNEYYEFLKRQQGASPDGMYKYKLVGNYSEMENILLNEPDTMAVVLSIEGGHALECGSPYSCLLSEREQKRVLSESIDAIKSWQFPPFYIGIAHHFYNQLCGHARSLKPPINLLFGQGDGVDIGINDLGWQAIEGLLTRINGPRILLDIKHMSVKARREFYQYITRHNNMYPDEKIPLICSHAGVNGYETMSDSVKMKDNGRKFRGSYYNNWSINLSDEEVVLIHESGGMIGIMMDKGLLGGPDTLRSIKMMSKEEDREKAYLKLILDNIFAIIKAVGRKSAWGIITLGTDYDGLITHIDGYENPAKVPMLKRKLVEYLGKYEYRKELWFGMTPEQLMSGIFSHNLIEFMKKNFTGQRSGRTERVNNAHIVRDEKNKKENLS